MGTITNLSDMIFLQTSGKAQHLNFFIDSRIGAAANVTASTQPSSMWSYNKSNGAHGAVPPVSPGEAPTRNTLGALKFNNPEAGKQLWLTGVEALGNAGGTFVLYDRLYHCSGLSGATISAQAVGGAVTRNVGGEGNQIWLEIHTAVGTTATTITASYTNQAGTAGQITRPVIFGGTFSRESERIIRLSLADGDTGVKSVQSVSLAGTTATAGDFGVVIARPLTRGFLTSGVTACFRDLVSAIPSMVEIDTDACPALVWYATGLSSARLDFTMHALEK